MPAPGDIRRDTPWHAMPVAQVLSDLGTAAGGLSDAEAAVRLQRDGPNILPGPRPVSALRILLDQFTSVVVWLLLAAAIVSLAIGDDLEAAAIGVALAISAGLGFTIDLRARRAMEALLHLDDPFTSAFRGGALIRIPVSAIVVGDVVELSAGHRVPADARVIQATDARAIEAPLTGESFPVEKHADLELPAETAIAERRNVVYRSTTIAGGAVRIVVTATGGATEIGRIGALVASIPEEQTPLERRLDDLGRRLVWLVLAIAAAVAMLGLANGAPAGLMLQLAIALAVAAVPEGLPAVATIALAIGLHRMARRHALVRRLAAVEALGCTTVICTDKTRTLTTGDMTVTRLWIRAQATALAAAEAAPAMTDDVRRALAVAVRASRPQPAGAGAPGWLGDPMDAAIFAAADAAGLQPVRLAADPPVMAFIPFSSDRKLMASFADSGEAIRASVKGAPDVVLGLCDRWLARDGDAPLDAGSRSDLLAANRAMAAEGLRVLALAEGAVSNATEEALGGLLFVGLLGISDPPAPGARAAVESLRRAGLRTIMLTGDQRGTAEAIGRTLGLLDATTASIDGTQLDAMSDDALHTQADRGAVFSRVTPAHKLRIVSALQRRGEIVAMLGDGVNDAPALKKADVGVAMGVRGTDVAKEAASIVLADDRFATIAAAVEEGRVIFDNIRKFVFYLFSCNVAEVLVLVVCGVAGLPIPLLPLQILWLNLVTDTFPALALAVEPGDADVMRRPPRSPKEAIVSRRFLSHVFVYAVIISAATIAAFAVGLSESHGKAATVSFMTLGLAQIFHLGNARSEGPVLHPRRASANLYAVAAVLFAVALQIASVSVDALARVLRLEALSAREWIIAFSLAAVPAIAGQTVKLVRYVAGADAAVSGTASTGTDDAQTTR